MRTIITCGLYISNPLFEGKKKILSRVFFCSFISNYYSLLGLGRGKGKRMLENTNSDEQKDSYGKNRGIGACQKKLKMGPIISENETDDEESESEQG